MTDNQPIPDLLSSAFTPHSGWQHPIRLASSLPWPLCVGATSFFSRRLPQIHMTAPHWPHLFVIAMQSLLAVSSSTAAPQDTLSPGSAPKTPSSVWDTTNKYIAAYLKRSDIAQDQSKVACQIITDIVTWSDEAIRVRQEALESWYKGQTWQNLAGIWIDLARKVSRVYQVSLTAQARDSQALDLALSTSALSMSLGCALAPRPKTIGDTATSEIHAIASAQALEHLTSLFAQFGAIEAAASATSSKSRIIVHPSND